MHWEKHICWLCTMEQKAHFVLLPFQAIYKLKYERRKKKKGGGVEAGGGGNKIQTLLAYSLGNSFVKADQWRFSSVSLPTPPF